MTDQVMASPHSGALPTIIKLLLIPSWVVGLGAVFMAIDLELHSIVPESMVPVIGNTVLVGGFLVAPLAMLLASLLAIWNSIRNWNRPTSSVEFRGLGVWTLIGLSFLCVAAAVTLTATFFRS
jgi:hypothetical protein